MCCALAGREFGEADVCLKNGLCANYLITNDDEFWRESCTDKSWQNESCLKLCITGVGMENT